MQRRDVSLKQFLLPRIVVKTVRQPTPEACNMAASLRCRPPVDIAGNACQSAIAPMERNFRSDMFISFGTVDWSLWVGVLLIILLDQIAPNALVIVELTHQRHSFVTELSADMGGECRNRPQMAQQRVGRQLVEVADEGAIGDEMEPSPTYGRRACIFN